MADRDPGAFDFLAAFAVGALFGAAAALLAAPQTGEGLRKDLGKKRKRLEKDARKQFGKAGGRLKESGGEWLDEAEEVVSELTTQVAAAVEDGVQTIRHAVADELKDLEKRMGRRKKGLFR